MVGDVLGRFQCALVLEICGDAGLAEGVVADHGLDTGVGRAALNHPVSVLLPHRLWRPRFPAGGAKQRPFRVFGDTGRRDVFIEVLSKL